MTLPSNEDWYSIVYTNFGFTAFDSRFNVAVYSIDGVNWSNIKLPKNIDWINITTRDLHFSILADGVESKKSRFGAYTTDGINWKITASSENYVDIYIIDDDRANLTDENGFPLISGDTTLWEPLVYGDQYSITIGFVTEFKNSEILHYR